MSHTQTLRLNGRLIQTGDTKGKVRAHAGEPYDTDRFTNRGYTITKWRYRQGNVLHTITFRGDKVSGFDRETI